MIDKNTVERTRVLVLDDEPDLRALLQRYLTEHGFEARAVAAGIKLGYNSHMEKASVSKLKDNLSAYLRKVRAGQSIVIYDRDVPIARLERIESSGRGADRLALLCAQGLTRPPARPISPA